jgi:hypothetical protein
MYNYLVQNMKKKKFKINCRTIDSKLRILNSKPIFSIFNLCDAQGAQRSKHKL